jgi:hypothetical protein
MVRPIAPLVGVLGLLNCSTPALAHPDVEIGLRAIGFVGNARPANNIGGAGLTARCNLADGWFVAASLDRYSYVFKRPDNIVGLGRNPYEEALNSTVQSTALEGEIGRHYGGRSGFEPLWSVGIGVAFPETSDVSGTTVTGPKLDLKIDAKTEILIMGAIGTSYHISKRWSFTAAFRLDYYFLDMSVMDRISGAVGRIDSQARVGAYLSVNAAIF